MQITTDVNDTREVTIPLPGGHLKGDLIIPDGARAIVVFAHGRGSSRMSSSNREVAREVRGCGCGTLLFELLTPEEERIDAHTSHLGFDIELLSSRVITATEWLKGRPQTRDLDVAYFGSSTGAAAVLVAAAERPQLIKAVICRGGRPDLADASLGRVRAATLMIAGGKDGEVLDLHRQAFDTLPKKTEKKLITLPDASHALDAPEALGEVARLTCRWLTPRVLASEHELSP